MSLDVKDLQLFFKRLRYYSPPLPRIRYYAVGEYGTKNWRPHYHVILFNANISCIQKAWELGDFHIGEVNEATIGYTLKYMCKEKRIPQHAADDRKKEFSVMSLGIGKGYLTPCNVSWHKEDFDNRCFIQIEDGKKIALPRYYRNKIYNSFEQASLADACQQRAEAAMLKEYLHIAMEYGEHNVELFKIEKAREAFRKMYFNALKDRQL